MEELEQQRAGRKEENEENSRPSTEQQTKPELHGEKEPGEEEIVLEEGAVFRRVYDNQSYTYWRIRRVMKELGWEMIQLWQGYKANRRPGYCECYRIVEKRTGRVIKECATLNQIRKAFAAAEVPLEDKKNLQWQQEKELRVSMDGKMWVMVNGVMKRRNRGAEIFMQCLNSKALAGEPDPAENKPD